MGKKSGSKGQGQGGADEGGAKAFVLKVDMHCQCDGCGDKIRAAVKDLTSLPGIQSWDQSALDAKGELRLVATADPEKLQHRLHKATRKTVQLLFPKPAKDGGKADKQAAKDAAVLLNALQQGHYGVQGGAGWANQLLAGGGGAYGGYGGASAAAAAQYPWAVQQPDPYAAYSGAWGGYAAYPPAPNQGYGGAYGGAWHGHGY